MVLVSASTTAFAASVNFPSPAPRFSLSSMTVNGLSGSPATATDDFQKMGQLNYEMWRAVRLVVDTGMHAFKWTRDQAVYYFKQNTGKSDQDINNEIDRYIAWPGQALGYKIGQLRISALRAEAEKALGDRFDVRAFHDKLLGSGALPLAVLETEMRAWIAEQSARR